MKESIRIDFSARINCEGLEILLTQFQLGSELQISLTTKVAKWGKANTYLHGGYDYSSRENKPGSWDYIEEPSNVLSYRGPVLFESPVNVNPAKFCGECGQARTKEGFFCIGCGQKFRDNLGLVGDLFDEVASLKKNSSGLAEFVLGLYETYCFSRIDPAPGAVLKQLLSQVATNPGILGLVNGRDDKPGTDGEISIGQAQAISERLKSQKSLSTQELELTRTILEHAPINFGYWGAIKAALKKLPIVGNEKSFGIALANISNAPLAEPAKEESRFVNLWGMFDSSWIPTSRTLNYMARRIRRELAKLAETNPNSYIEVAKHFAVNWQEPYKARSFAAGFIFHGGTSYLNESGRAIDRALAPGRRTEAFPELWTQSPTAVLEIFSSNVRSSKALTLAYQVAEDLMIELPKLQESHIKYAIKSPYIPLRKLGIAALVESESSYETYDFETCLAVFKDASDEQIAKLFKNYRAYYYTPAAYSFMSALKQAVLTRVDLPVQRLARLAEFALNFPYQLNWSNRLQILQVAVGELGISVFESNPNVLATFQNEELVALVRWLESEGISSQLITDAVITSSVNASAMFTYGRFHNIVRFLELESDLALEIAWAVLDADQSDDVALRLLSSEAIQNLSAKFKKKFVNQLILHTPLALIPEVLREVHDQSDAWRGFDVVWALSQESGPSIAWQILGMDSLPDMQRAIVSSKSLVKAVGDNLQISEMRATVGAQGDLAIAYLATDKMRVKIDPEFVLAAATSASTALSQAGLGTLKANKLVGRYWIRLAESGLPECLNACRDYLATLRNSDEITASVVALLDSPTESAKRLGLSLLDAPTKALDLDRIWSSLTESDDPEILARVAEEALVRDSIPDDRLASMDRRVLVSRRKARVAKESVKQRIDGSGFELAPERMTALLELARAQNRRDREWAISRLAILSINGLSIPSFEAFEVSGVRI